MSSSWERFKTITTHTVHCVIIIIILMYTGCSVLIITVPTELLILSVHYQYCDISTSLQHSQSNQKGILDRDNYNPIKGPLHFSRTSKTTLRNSKTSWRILETEIFPETSSRKHVENNLEYSYQILKGPLDLYYNFSNLWNFFKDH